ncbi:hypothetical protein CEXT_200901 [Caerostris extrusa]|uniref:Uncharacterized protein n=1 Tax=Caerostris extrusa TaxID=172846 RepID=A0AAV4TQC2_CAEEX|nr:hypothetical protein CEXT_200901 [Caerostris extrusa]
MQISEKKQMGDTRHILQNNTLSNISMCCYFQSNLMGHESHFLVHPKIIPRGCCSARKRESCGRRGGWERGGYLERLSADDRHLAHIANPAFYFTASLIV